jgi:hypothetical protein
MPKQITLHRSAQQILNLGAVQGYRLTVTAENPVDMPSEIFRMILRPLDPIAQTQTPQFDGVCSIADLSTLPINAPIPPDNRYRVNTISVIYYTGVEGDDAWNKIKAHTADLVRSLNLNDILINEETVTFGP